MKTLGDIIVCKRDPIPDKFEGTSIIKPECVIDAEKNECERGVIIGTVMVAGPDCHTLKAGDRIMYHKSQYVPMEHEGQDFAVFHESHVLALVED